jgi:hypothetical protein
MTIVVGYSSIEIRWVKLVFDSLYDHTITARLTDAYTVDAILLRF